MREPIRLDALLAEQFETFELEVSLPVIDELDETEPVDDIDFALAPEFSDFQVWCEVVDNWAATWRRNPSGRWLCAECDSADHRPRDHEGI